MTSSTNERQIAKRKAVEADNRINDELVMRDLMSTPRGRAWMWRRLSDARFFHFDMALDPHFMAFEKGMKFSMGKLLKDAQSFTPQEYIIMTEENSGVPLSPPQTEETDDE